MTPRPARESDAAALGDLRRRFTAEEHEAVPDAEPQAALAGWSERLRLQIVREQVFVLETDRGIAGFAAFIDSAERPWVPESVAYPVHLYVQPEDRGDTGGSQLD
jgi:hypothetical protein